VEVFLLVLFAVLAIVHGHHVTAFSWHWFSLSAFGDKGSSGFAAGALLAAFYYWGWDVTSNLSEETKNAHKTSGAGGLIGAFIVFLLFEVFTVATNMVLTPAQMTDPNNSADILSVLGQTVWPGLGGKLIVVAVLLSTVATLETTLIQVTRTLFAMGRDVTIPAKFGQVHPIRKTPLFATAFVAVASVLLYVGSNYVGSISTILSDGYAAIGLQICFYYAMAGFAVVILYRRQLTKSVANFLLIGVWPFGGAVFMLYVLYNVLPGLNGTTLLVGLGSMAIGLVPMGYYMWKKVPYFTPPTREDRHAVLEEFEQNL
jgi:amino acid transporter